MRKLCVRARELFKRADEMLPKINEWLRFLVNVGLIFKILNF
jgi:hypothetical protein